MVILPPKVLVPETVKAEVFTELVIAALDVIVSEAKVIVPEYCRSRIAPEPIETTPVLRAPALPTARVPALILVAPV